MSISTTYLVASQTSNVPVAEAGGMVDLNHSQMQRLAKIIYLQEAEAIQNINFASEHELTQYLRDCKTGYEHTLILMDKSNEDLAKYQGDTTKEPIAHDIFGYVKLALNYSMQSVRNFSLRLDYLKKVAQHSEQIFLDLETLDASNAINVARLAKEAVAYNKSLIQYNKRYQTLSSSTISDWIKESGMTFEEILAKYQGALGLQGAFNELEAVDKLKVYNKIIEASGEGNVTMNTIEEASSAIGLGVLVLTAGLMVWDICTSQEKVYTAVSDGTVIASSIAGNVIGNMVKTFLTVEVVGLIEVSSWVIPVVGFVVGCIAGYVISKIGDWLINLIFGHHSGSSTQPAPPPPPPPLTTEGHRCYAAKMPDGLRLARQIVYSDMK